MAMLMCIYPLNELVENYTDINHTASKGNHVLNFVLNLHPASHSRTWGGVLKNFTVP